MNHGIIMLENNISVGIVADWLVTYAGAERVVKEMIELFPDSDVYSIVDFLSDEARLILITRSPQQPLYSIYRKRNRNTKLIYH